MKFISVVPNENYDISRLISEEGQWELGLTRMMFGVRVRGGKVGEGWRDIDLCAGDDPQRILQILELTKLLLENVPENAEGLSRFVPSYPIKPIWRNENWEDEFLRCIIKVKDHYED